MGGIPKNNGSYKKNMTEDKARFSLLKKNTNFKMRHLPKKTSPPCQSSLVYIFWEYHQKLKATVERVGYPAKKRLLYDPYIMRKKPRPKHNDNLPQPVFRIGRDKTTISNVPSDLQYTCKNGDRF